jgi:hypothetical protein
VFSRTKIALASAIVLASAFASAATEHHRISHGHAANRNMLPDYNNNQCPPSGGPACSERCLPSGPPCRTRRDDARAAAKQRMAMNAKGAKRIFAMVPLEESSLGF